MSNKRITPMHPGIYLKELIDELIRLSRDYGIMTPYTSGSRTAAAASASARVE